MSQPLSTSAIIDIVYEKNGEGNGTPLQCSCLETPMDGGAWQAAVHGVVKSRTRLSDFPFTLHFHALEKEMAPHSSILAWRIPGTGEPGRLPSMGSQRVYIHINLNCAAAKSLQSCPTLCDPIDGSPPGSLVPGIFQARTLEWVAISFSNA